MVFVLIEFIRCCNLSYNLKTCIFYALLMIRLTLPNLPMKYGSWLLDLKKWQRRLQMCDPGFLIIHAVTRYPIFRFSSSMMMMMMFWRLDDLHTKDVFFFFFHLGFLVANKSRRWGVVHNGSVAFPWSKECLVELKKLRQVKFPGTSQTSHFLNPKALQKWKSRGFFTRGESMLIHVNPGYIIMVNPC